mmetsp:Transcript_2674/g.5573  ORF Transcript_2674/g.5573 Transcript_2674/m.5573 type:complete len:412 (+) Transcript_2674:303-1538(+)
MPKGRGVPRLRRQGHGVRRVSQPDRHRRQQEQVLHHPAARDRRWRRLLLVDSLGSGRRGAELPERAQGFQIRLWRRVRRVHEEVQGQDWQRLAEPREFCHQVGQVHAHPPRPRRLRTSPRGQEGRRRCRADRVQARPARGQVRLSHLRRVHDGGEHARDRLRPGENAAWQAAAAHHQGGLRDTAEALRAGHQRRRRRWQQWRRRRLHRRRRSELSGDPRADEPLLLARAAHLLLRGRRHARQAAAHQQHAHPQEEARDVRGPRQHRDRFSSDRLDSPRHAPARRQVRTAQDRAQARRHLVQAARHALKVPEQHARIDPLELHPRARAGLRSRPRGGGRALPRRGQPTAALARLAPDQLGGHPLLRPAHRPTGGAHHRLHVRQGHLLRRHELQECKLLLREPQHALRRPHAV